MAPERLHAISKALSDPTRFNILQRIAAELELASCALNDEFPVTQATISHHIRELHDAGLIEIRRQAQFIHLKLNRPVWNEYVATLASLVPPFRKTRRTFPCPTASH